ncbi:MAG: DUF4266 domain-containing protein [Saprospiraceae bacterium]|nr:DUF4266 domain-containing protein [Saprospiraceae bacterium]
MEKYIFQIILISNNEKGIFIVAATMLMLSSCATVSRVSRMYINDSEMELSLRTGKNLNMLSVVQRRGCRSNWGKSGSGCGCN